MLGKLKGMNDEYWLTSELVAREVMKKMGKSPQEIEDRMQEVRKQLRYGYVKVDESDLL